jgi:hypothetical protein
MKKTIVKTTSKSERSITIAVYIIAAAILVLGLSHIGTSYAQTNSNNNLAGVMKNIDAGVSAIKSGDSNGAKKSLLQAESALEGNPKLSTAEKHVESSLQALKDGDTNGAINHAQEAKGGLSSV